MIGRDRWVTYGAVVAGALAATSLRAEQALTFAQIASERRPHPAELEAEALLVEAAGAAVGAGSFVLEAPTASVAAGPRRFEQGDTQAEMAVDVELPLLTDRGSRQDLATRLDGARDAIRTAGRATALADLAAAYAHAWLTQTAVELREQDLSIMDTWFTATQRRVEAGADPPYESLLVAGERDRALLDLLSARREVELAWAELARSANVASQPRPLDLATLPGAQPPERAANMSAGSAALAGIEARREVAILLARARSAAASSRWAVAGEVAGEGEERLVHLGFAYRFSRGGERAVILEAQTATEIAAAAEAAAATGDVRGRLAAAEVALASPPSALAADDYQTAQRALESRLAEGKDRASDVLPLRRQLLEATLAAAEARAARAQAAAELFFLDGGGLP